MSCPCIRKKERKQIMVISSNWSGFIELVRLLTHLMSLVKRFLMFSGGTEIGQ